jgi:hypothetical protein
VRKIGDFYDFYDDSEYPPSTVFTEMAKVIWDRTLDNEKYQSYEAPNSDGPYGIDNLCAAMFLFSDNTEGSGWVLGKWLKRKFPKQVKEAYAINPNSGMRIGTWMWTPNARELLFDPLWVNGFRMAAEELMWQFRGRDNAFRHDYNWHDTLREMRRLWAEAGKPDLLAGFELRK